MSREAELYKDKIEVSLDGRQIFYLFFGGSVIVGMVFVLGVMVGRRVEARGHVDHAHTTAASDPLAALDRLETTGDVDKKIDKLAADKAAPAPVPPPAPEKPAQADKPAVEAKAEKSEKADKHDDKAEKHEKKDKKKKDADKDREKSDHEAQPQKAAQADDAPKGRFTLQLSSFQDKGEAQSFLDNMKAAGFEAYLTEAEVDGKGTFYRIRLGNYKSMDAANDAKAEFEKASKRNANVMRL